MIPVSSPFSHWSKKRMHSCKNPICGPGSKSIGNWCDHGPMSAFFGQVRPSMSLNTGSRYPSHHPPIAYTAQVMAAKSSFTEPCFQ